MFTPRATDKNHHHENHKTLFDRPEKENGKKPFHVRA